MKKLNLSFLKETDILSREEKKDILAGSGSGSGGGCCIFCTVNWGSGPLGVYSFYGMSSRNCMNYYTICKFYENAGGSLISARSSHC